MTSTATAPAGIAQLRNVDLFAAAMDEAMRRPLHLPGLVCFYGPSGYGKSRAAAYAANVHRAYIVEARSTWTKRALAVGILNELGIDPAQRVYDMVAQISEALARSGRPLILDEADFVLAGGMIEIIRDIHEASGSVVAMIGEERLPNKLRAVERVHNRVAFWVAAVPSDLSDARALARLYAKDAVIADDLLAAVVAASDGGARRIVTNLHTIQQEARKAPAKSLDLAWWGKRQFFTGRVEARTQFAPQRGRAA